ncbi:MAG TPA: CoA-binding protein [Actinomycetota bacterium]|nr:CoA-binding protein [Actinomycetota bacterium]
MDDLRERIRAALDPSPSAVPAPGDRLAAVLLPLSGSEPSIVLTRRADHLSRHAGEISFPGGLRHPEDADLRETALRETEEELGIAPDSVDVLGALPPVHTTVSAILVVPFVGMLEGAAGFTPDVGEIAEVVVLPVPRLAEAETEVEWAIDREVYRGYRYEVGGHTIWGATARILHGFLRIVWLPDDDRVEEGDPEPYLPGDAELRAILGDARTIAVVGLSSKPHRESYEIAEYLQRKGYRILPINPRETEVLGQEAYPTLLDVPSDVRIDVVDVFRKAADTPPLAEQAVRVGARVLWLQDGIVNEEARRIAESGGLTVVMGVCIRRTRKRLTGEG